MQSQPCPHLLVILVRLVVNDVEEAKLVHSLRGRDYAEPVTELLLLEELLGAAGWLASITAYCDLT